MHPKARALQERLQKFALAVARLCDALPRVTSAQRFAGQLIDSSSSAHSNYRAACRARSRAEFIAKLGVVVEEMDESEGWLTMLRELNHIPADAADRLLGEANELLSIFVASQLTAKSRRGNGR